MPLFDQSTLTQFTGTKRYYRISRRHLLTDGDLLPTSRTKVMEQSPLISENSGYETIQIYR
jgi:hypothetical protein